MKYKLAQRKGRCVQVSFDDGKTWKSTGCYSKQDAEARLRSESIVETGIKLKDYAEGFYTSTGANSVRTIDKMKGRERQRQSYYNMNKALINNILPELGDRYMQSITNRDIDNWYTSLSHNGVLYSSSHRNLCLTVIREVFNKAVRDGVISTNPTLGIKKVRQTKKKKSPLTKEELSKLFPDSDDELVKIWGSIQWAGFFLISRETGFRPSEICALKKEDIDFKTGTIYTDKEVNRYREVLGRIKTSDSGQNYKIGIVSERTLRILSQLDDGFMFFDKKGGIANSNISYKVFKHIASKVLGRTDVTQYCLRHYFMTEKIGKLPKELIMQLMGHTQWEATYDDSTKEMIVERFLKDIKNYQ